MASATYLDPEQLHHALALRDLTDPEQGSHAIQLILDAVVTALRTTWPCTTRTVRNPPIVAVRDNYDRLGYPAQDVTRAQRYTRYLSPTTMLRSHTSAELPRALESYRTRSGVDELIIVPGLVHRRDVVDRSHVGEPHQVDLWRLRDRPDTSDDDMVEMIGLVVEAVLPGCSWQTTAVEHPYTVGGRQVDVLVGEEWLELAECGRIHPDVLRGAGLDPQRWSGLALGMGLDRAVMVRKSLPDVRYLRAREPRIAVQMNDLDRWRPVSPLPATRRDISVLVPENEDEETVGDLVRTALGDDVEVIESVELLNRTRYDDLPVAARDRLGAHPGQCNLLVRITLRPIERTLTAEQANELRNRIYRAIHRGPVMELI